MSAPGFEDYQVLANSMNQMLYERVTAATPIEVLSTHDDKLLQVVEAADGERFVTRSYTSEAVRDIEASYGIDFRSAWGGMHDAFANVGIEVVPSQLIETDGEYPFIVVSEYLEDGQPLSTAPTKTKKAVADSLGRLLTTDGKYIPAPEMIREDMFLVVERDGQIKALVIDVDPRVTTARRMQRNDQNSAFFITKLAELAWDKWCGEDEKMGVTTVLVHALGDYALDRFDFSSATTAAFMDLHLMSNGVDRRGREEQSSSTIIW